MKNRLNIIKIFYALALIVLLFTAYHKPVKADIAPPEQPSGGNPVPDQASTKVRMMAETVLIEVISTTPSGSLGKAKVTANFTMLNLGETDEALKVRFPLVGPYGSSYGSKEIEDFKVSANGVALQFRRIESDFDGLYAGPWAEFSIAFPTGKEVPIQVTYLVEGEGEYPFIAFKYILHTGSGWNGTIGAADLIVRLPYEATPQNVILDTEIGWSTTTPGGVFSGREIRWRFEDFEPEFAQDFTISLVMPLVWRTVLREQDNLAANPQDGEAWGRLGKLYKETFFLRRGFREDTGGLELYRLSREAYERAVALLPEDALWQAGYADLLWNHWYWSERFKELPDYAELTQALQLIQRSLELSPRNEKALAVLDDIRYSYPEAVQEQGGEYILLHLTATPTMVPSPSLTPSLTATTPPTETPAPTLKPTYTLEPFSPSFTPKMPTPNLTSATPISKPKGILPVCGIGILAPLANLFRLRKPANKGSSVLGKLEK